MTCGSPKPDRRVFGHCRDVSGVSLHDGGEDRAVGTFRRTCVRSHVTRTLTCTVQQMTWRQAARRS